MISWGSPTKTARQKPFFCRRTIWCHHWKLVKRQVRHPVGHLAPMESPVRRNNINNPTHGHKKRSSYFFCPTFFSTQFFFKAVQNERGIGLRITWIGRCEWLGIVLRKARCSAGMNILPSILGLTRAPEENHPCSTSKFGCDSREHIVAWLAWYG